MSIENFLANCNECMGKIQNLDLNVADKEIYLKINGLLFQFRLVCFS